MVIKRILLIVFAISVLATASLAADEHSSPRKRVFPRKHKVTSLNDGPKINYHKRFTARKNQATPVIDGPKFDYRKRIAARKHLKAAASSSLDGPNYLKRLASRKDLKATPSADGPKIDYQKLFAARKNWAASLNGKKVSYRKNLDGPKIDYQKLIAARKHLASKETSDKASTVKPVATKLPTSEMRKRMIARRNQRSSTHGFKFLPSFKRFGANKPMTMAPAPAPTIPFPLPLTPSPSPCASENKP